MKAPGDLEHKSFLYSILFPLLFVVLLWAVRLVQELFGVELTHLGLYPRSLSGLAGIFTAPLIHGDRWHLLSNTVPLLGLGIIMFLFYRKIAFQVFGWIYIMTGLWVWAAGREVYHIGASGIAYGFVCFIFFSGIFRRDMRLLRPSLLVLLFYGGMISGILPTDEGISWESHALGSLAGIITAFYFRKEGPQPKKHVWDDEDDEDDTDPYWEEEDKQDKTLSQPQQQTIRYIYIERKSGEESNSTNGSQ